MKIRVAILGCLIGTIVLFVGYEGGSAEPKVEKDSLQIGVVSVRRIFQNSSRHAGYMEKAVAERKSAEAELDKLSKEIEAEKAGLKTLKQGSSDYLSQMKEVMTKQAGLQAKQDFYKRQMELKDQQWTEQLYKDILQQSSEIAKEKGLALVFEKDEVELPAASANELMLTIRTHKLLYSDGCLDITDEVMARIDAKN
ncbi:MAG: hypothetical protein DRP62_06310 [Planctomycetota bacterium]|nr:MAG: hypothetical protein DRP62_06310 [Planctomycetota bacterium]